MTHRAFRNTIVLSILVVAAACGKDESPPVPTKLLVTTEPSATVQNRAAFAAQPVIQLADNDNKAAPKAGVVVTAAVTTAGAVIGGTSTATTNESGAATFTNLRIEGVSGPHQITFTADGLQSVTSQTLTTPGAATTIALDGGNNQTAAVNTAVATDPSVKVTDADGNAVSNVSVTFSAATGGGSVAGGTQGTNTLGVATVTSWTLGTTAGTNTLTATAAGLSGSPVTFTATATPGAASKLVVSTSASATAQNRVAFATQPAIRLQDAFNNNVSQAGVNVTASITSGGGTLQGTATIATDASGIATFTNLAIAGTVGARALGFTATGLSGTSMNVTTTAGAAASIAVNAGNNQTATISTAVANAPSVKITDLDGNNVSGTAVTWAVASGGGSATGTSTTSNSSGVATVGSWTLGPSAGTNTLTATSTGLTGSPVTFTATGVTSLFNIQIVYLTSVTPAQEAAFNAAVAKWQSIITGDVVDANATNVPANSCHPAVNEIIDDVKIFVTLEPIDGAGQVLGSAGPCLLRVAPSSLPATGAMRFDTADLAALEASGQLTDVILHEMGHVLGVGTLWATKSVIADAGTANPYFTGAEANVRFDAVGGAAYVGSPGVPVENTGGSGTADAHWRETNFNTELMTGFLDGGVANPLSVVTIGSLQDIGYVVSFAPADAYTLFSAALRTSPARKIHFGDDILKFDPIYIPLAPRAPRPPSRP